MFRRRKSKADPAPEQEAQSPTVETAPSELEGYFSDDDRLEPDDLDGLDPGLAGLGFR